MQRRDLLRGATAAVAAGAMLTAEKPALAAERSGRQISAPRRAGMFVQTRDGTELFFRDWGDGPAFVFLSGWALTSDCWAYQMTPLSESGLRCIAYDRRGHGRSADPGRGFDYDTLADDLADVLEALQLQNVTLIAHSMAGGEAVRYLSRHGSKRIARIALVGATLPLLMKTDDNPDGIDPAVLEKNRRTVLLKDFPQGLKSNIRPFVVPETSDALLDWIASQMLRCSMKALLECNRALTSTDFRAELPKLTVPTLIVHGDRDASAPLALTGRKAAALMPHAQLKIYEGAPHGLMYTHTEQFNRDLLQFAGSG